MVEAGVLQENDRVELVEGALVDMMPISAEHDGALAWLTRHFARVDAQEWDSVVAAPRELLREQVSA